MTGRNRNRCQIDELDRNDNRSGDGIRILLSCAMPRQHMPHDQHMVDNDTDRGCPWVLMAESIGAERGIERIRIGLTRYLTGRL